MKQDILATSRPNEYKMNCPYCVNNGHSEDTGYHLGFNEIKGIFHCYRCDERGYVNQLLGYAEVTKKIPGFEEIKGQVSKLFSLPKKLTFDLDKISYPVDEIITPFAYKYLLERNITPEEWTRYKVRVGKYYYDEERKTEVKKWSGRILFPFYENSVVTFIVGRSHTGSDPKYLNSEGSKGVALYGLDFLGDSRVAIVCEGIISGFSATRHTGIPAIPILGKTITETQADKLRSRVDEVILSVDGDVSEVERSKLIRTLHERRFKKISEIRLPEDMDPDELGANYNLYFNQRKDVTWKL